MGRKIAFVGDGTNDAPALQEADLGISMASGTEVCKAAANVVLENDEFASVMQYINWGND